MPENVVRFYVAELALGLEYLHSRGIVHRCADRCNRADAAAT